MWWKQGGIRGFQSTKYKTSRSTTAHPTGTLKAVRADWNQSIVNVKKLFCSLSLSVILFSLWVLWDSRVSADSHKSETKQDERRRLCFHHLKTVTGTTGKLHRQLDESLSDLLLVAELVRQHKRHKVTSFLVFHVHQSSWHVTRRTWLESFLSHFSGTNWTSGP